MFPKTKYIISSASETESFNKFKNSINIAFAYISYKSTTSRQTICDHINNDSYTLTLYYNFSGIR